MNCFCLMNVSKIISDLQKAWKTLLKIYVGEQQKIDLEKIFDYR